MTPRIENAINVFIEALEKGTLAKGTCAACAVGNLVADGMNHTIEKSKAFTLEHWGLPNAQWGKFFTTCGRYQNVHTLERNRKEVIENIKATQFSLTELMKIEYAFETNTEYPFTRYWCLPDKEIRADQLKGLEAVVQVMLDFDDVRETVQDVFTTKAMLVPINL